MLAITCYYLYKLVSFRSCSATRSCFKEHIAEVLADKWSSFSEKCDPPLMALGQRSQIKLLLTGSCSMYICTAMLTCVDPLLNETKCHLVSFSLVANQTKWH